MQNNQCYKKTGINSLSHYNVSISSCFVILNAVKDLQMQALCRVQEIAHCVRDVGKYSEMSNPFIIYNAENVFI
ncbi:Uncharacterised protein [Legionella quateirensis]|uniref:Uncharacterized protein n=1 Tax=Legionella quateirensis TaxID=45072 RepID=A0A378L2Z3_9GAMM|nr:hypothetical protein Lqua_2140 [Legionella quateirensis]STY18490.1 Uncharacterised protein [Legionella quateirensis]